MISADILLKKIKDKLQDEILAESEVKDDFDEYSDGRYDALKDIQMFVNGIDLSKYRKDKIEWIPGKTENGNDKYTCNSCERSVPYKFPYCPFCGEEKKIEGV